MVDCSLSTHIDLGVVCCRKLTLELILELDLAMERRMEGNVSRTSCVIGEDSDRHNG
jgi:hypothetical protein